MTQEIIDKSTHQLTIIVVTKNDYKNLLLTFNSFNFPDDIRKNIQLILIDGGSTDETQSFIKTHSSEFSQIISEPDEGIYDAMNKGIELASGDWTIFINAGDTFADSMIPGRLFEKLDPNIDVLYGDCILKYPGFELIRKTSELSDLWKGMITSHQSFVIKTKLLKENKFNPDYKLGADFDQIFKLYKQGRKFVYLPFPISRIDATGVSNTKILSTRCEHYQSLKSNIKTGIGKHLYYIINFLFLTGINICRLILPKKIYYIIIKGINTNKVIRL